MANGKTNKPFITESFEVTTGSTTHQGYCYGLYQIQGDINKILSVVILTSDSNNPAFNIFMEYNDNYYVMVFCTQANNTIRGKLVYEN